MPIIRSEDVRILLLSTLMLSVSLGASTSAVQLFF